jgi:hypothetical protein
MAEARGGDVGAPLRLGYAVQSNWLVLNCPWYGPLLRCPATKALLAAVTLGSVAGVGRLYREPRQAGPNSSFSAAPDLVGRDDLVLGSPFRAWTTHIM